jgi:anti-sigma regulatory factor (Ser/Thr protein kinase)
MAELPHPFANEDEEAAAQALGPLNQAISEALTNDARHALIERALRFMQKE